VFLFTAAILAGAWALLRRSDDERNPTAPKDRALFAFVTLLVAVVGYAVFLWVLQYATQPWYYILIMVFAAVCMEMLFTAIPVKKWLWFARCGFALAFIGATTFPAWQALQVRQTNIDLIARQLDSLAQEGDLILVSPWNYGITFQRNYHRDTAWVTLPPVEDLRFHRCDIIKRQMMSPAPMEPVLVKMGETLRAGKTIWVVGQLMAVPPGERPLELPPGYDSPEGFRGGNFYRAWMEQAGFFIQTHSRTVDNVQRTWSQPIMHYETPALTAVRGWRSDSGL
jgi:hypothetical protein